MVFEVIQPHERPSAPMMIINAQNVADYYFETDKIYWKDEDYANVAPPAERIWIEWRLPAMMRLGETEKALPDKGTGFGVFLNSTKIKDPIQELPENWPGDRLNVTWDCTATLYILFKGADEARYYGGVRYGVDAQGSLKINDGKRLCAYADATLSAEGREKAAERMGIVFNVPFLTLCFMHCKNIDLVPDRIPSPVLNKRRAERGKEPLLKTYMLNIRPVRKMIQEVTGSAELSPKSMHICRGHFKHFDTNPLFGKLRGTYWWPMHVKGKEEVGRVVKGYNVKAL